MGDFIPLGSRILAIADTFDVLITRTKEQPVQYPELGADFVYPAPEIECTDGTMLALSRSLTLQPERPSQGSPHPDGELCSSGVPHPFSVIDN